MTYKILVTGGSGFIGTNLLALYADRQDVHLLNLDARAPRNPLHQTFWQRANLLDAQAITQQIRAFNPDYLFHLAARADMDGRTLEDYAANIKGVSHLIDAVQNCTRLKRIVFASSRMTCRIGYQPANATDYCPSTVYGESKVLGEQLVYAASPKLPSWVLVRPTSIWGPWFDIPYRQFFDAVQAGIYIHPRGYNIRKSFGYVGNTVYQLDRLMFADTASVNHRMFYLCDDPPLEVFSFAQQIAAEFSSRGVISVPLPLLKLCALAGDGLKKLGMHNPPLTRFRLGNLLTEMLHDTQDLPHICGPLPHSLTDGVRATVAWMRSNTV